MQSGWGKLNNLSGVTEFFTSLGLPAPHFTAIAISNLELFGGAFFALGLGSRLIALVLSGNMFMAYVTADREALLSVFSDIRASSITLIRSRFSWHRCWC